MMGTETNFGPSVKIREGSITCGNCCRVYVYEHNQSLINDSVVSEKVIRAETSL